ncbi:amino acid transporter [Subtercola boreus]|uniref:Amino acid transporter n=1 Tax=Subtercola boreus TaxID=120213 RepID=A0A3E0VAZ9_9MICO|nr:APC family permease [Subtercola boreus]RFA06919.1 amino acid transporter [Subtercola boreus]
MPTTSAESPTTAIPDSTTARTALRSNALGVSSLVFIVISAAAPLTVIAGIGPLAILIGGIGAPLAYLIAGLVLAIFAVAFMAMTRHIRALGGFYTYIAESLGKVLGLGASTLAWFSYNALQIGLYGLFGVQANGLIKIVSGVDVPWWLLAALCIAAVYVVASRGVDVGARLLAVLLSAETLILLIFAVAVFAQHGAAGITFGSFDPATLMNPGMLAILGFAFAAFMGFESTVLYRAEARRPDITIPRATYISVIFMGLFYAFIIWAIIIALGEANAVAGAADDSATLVFRLAAQYLGPWAEITMYVLVVTSVFAAQLAFHNAINRYSFALARDGVFPRALFRTGATTGAPWPAGLVQTVLAAVVVGLFAAVGADPYLQLVLWVNGPGAIGIVALQALTSVAVVVFFVRHRNIARAWYVLPAAVLSALAMLALLTALIGTLDLLTAAGPVVNTILISAVTASFIIGAVLASVWRRTRPSVYARIGGTEEIAS